MSPEDKALLQSRLNDARAKYHQLVTGQLPSVFVDQNGERVEFSKANLTKLHEYIVQLELLLSPQGQGAMKALRPIGFYF
jgi:hypothetical protein